MGRRSLPFLLPDLDMVLAFGFDRGLWFSQAHEEGPGVV